MTGAHPGSSGLIRRRFLYGLAAVLLVTLPCCGVPLFCLSLPTIQWWANRVPFNSQGWKAAESGRDRYDMSWDLVRRDLLSGKTPAEIEELLGRPMKTDILAVGQLPMFAASPFEPGVEVWYYDLGGEKYEWQIGPSGAVLAVDFRKGKVVRVRKVVH
jgi:hypothetical protein